MKTLTTIFQLDEAGFETIQSIYSLREFLISIICIDLVEGIELELNTENLKQSIEALNEKLSLMENQVLVDDYISISIYDSLNKKIYKHENKRCNFKTNSIVEIITQPHHYPNYLDENTIPWWRNEI